MSKNEKDDGKIGYLVFANVISVFAVLGLHTNGCFWSFSATERYWFTANILESIYYFAVPVFFMTSGITLMDFYDRNSLGQYFVKRLKKTFIPFIAWSFIGIAWDIANRNINLSDITPKYIYQGITGTTIIQLYWFFTPLFIIYLCMPLFAAVEINKRKLVFSYLVIVGIILNFTIPFFNVASGLYLNTPYSLPVVSSSLIWPPVGWLLHNCDIKKKQKIIVYIFSVIGLAMHIIGTYILSMNAGEIVSTYKGYQNLPCILYSIGIFVLLKDIGTFVMRKTNWFTKLIVCISRYSLPIYLMQFIFLNIGRKLPFVDYRSIWYRLGAPFVIIPCIMLITWCMRKIPIVRHIVP